MIKQTNRIGEENYNTFGTLMKVVEYKDCHNMTIEFQDGYKYKKKCSYDQFKKGEVKNPYDKTIYNVGYMGEGKYKKSKNRKHTKAFESWHGMLQRCYDPYELNKRPTYIDCYVCEEWLCFQNFAKWFYKEYYEYNGKKTHLDKDILCKNNKIYSPETCIFVPQRINVLFTKRQNCRGKYPIGVNYCERDKALISRCDVFDKEKNKSKNVHLDYFPLDKPFQAFTIYKQFKENYIKQVADEYKDMIPQKLYDALYNYEVEIND